MKNYLPRTNSSWELPESGSDWTQPCNDSNIRGPSLERAPSISLLFRLLCALYLFYTHTVQHKHDLFIKNKIKSTNTYQIGSSSYIWS